MPNTQKIAKENYKQSMETPYAVSRRYGSLTFDEAVQNAKNALNQADLEVVTQFDLHDHVQEDLGQGIKRYTILGACNPSLALDALAVENKAGIMLPCNVIIQELELEGMIEVSVADPAITFSLAQNEKFTKMGAKAKKSLHQILNNIENQNVKL